MKTRKSLVVVLGMLILSLPCSAVPIIDLVLSDTDLVVGDTFSFNVIANGVTDIDPLWGPDALLSFGFNLDYIATEFEYNGMTLGGYFLDDSASFDDVEIAGSVFPGASGDGILLATLTFTALASGDDLSLGIISDILNPNQGLSTLIYWDDPFMGNTKIDMTSSFSFNVGGSVSPVPEPSTLILGITGLFGLFGVQKIKRIFQIS